MKRTRQLYGLLLILFLLTACGLPFVTKEGETKQLTPKAQATLLMNTYEREVRDLQSLAGLPSRTAEQTRLFIEKRRILTQIKPHLDTYVSIVEAGGIPTSTQQSEVNNYINQLVALTAGGVK